MEKNEVTSAKRAVSISKKNAKKAAKKEKKAAKKQEKKDRKDIRSAYTKALRSGNTDTMLAFFAILLVLIPIIAQEVMDFIDSKKKS